MNRLTDGELALMANLSTRACGLEIPEAARPGVLLNARILDGHMNKVLDFMANLPESEIPGEAAC